MRTLLSFAVAGAALAAISSASAAPLAFNVLVNGTTISGGPVSFADGFNPGTTYTSGGFSVTVTGSGDPFQDSPNFTNTAVGVVVAAGTSGTVKVMTTDYNLPSFTGTTMSTLGINALTAASLTSSSVTNYFDGSNTPFGTGTQLATLNGAASTSLTGGGAAAVSLTGPFSETTIYTYTFSAATRAQTVQGNSQIAATAVPEPVSIALLGTGLAAIGLIRRKRA